jgi:hypothetical protein
LAADNELVKHGGPTAGVRQSKLSSRLSVVLGPLLAILLVVAVAEQQGFGFGDLLRSLDRHGLALFVAAVVSLALQSWLSALKWCLLQERLSDRDEARRQLPLLVFYSSAATVFGQFLPTVVATSATRGLATRAHLRGNLIGGAGLALYDQLFDLAVLAAAALAAILLLVAGVSLVWAAAAILAALVVTSLFGRWLFARVRPIALGRRLLAVVPGAERYCDALLEAHTRGLDAPETAVALLRLSILRYLAIGIRSVAAVLLVAPGLHWSEAAWGFAAVQGSAVLALTPGNIGITEWGWALVEQVLALPAGQLVVAVLGLRVVSLPAALLVTVLALIPLRKRAAAG